MTAIRNKISYNNLFFVAFASFVTMSFKFNSQIPMFLGCVIYSIGLVLEVFEQIKRKNIVLAARKILGIISLIFVMLMISLSI